MSEEDEFIIMTSKDKALPRKPKERSYDIPPEHFKSLQEIKLMIKQNKYTSVTQAKTHLDFLERMAEQLNKILVKEQQLQILDLDTPHFIQELKKIYDKVYDIYIKLIEKLPNHHEEIKKKKKKSATISGLSTGSFGSGRFG